MNRNYTTSILVERSPDIVFNRINDVGQWWQGEIKGSSHQQGDEFTYEMKGFHFTRQLVTELIPGKKVTWLVTESRINFVEQPDEWKNTRIVFDIAAEQNKTRLTFTHQGLLPSLECYGSCSNAWQKLIGSSLFSFIGSGKGVDVF